LLIHEIQDFFRAVPRVSAGRGHSRDFAILALGFVEGLRVSEIAGLEASQVDLRAQLRRKGGRVQTLPRETRAAQMLADWIVQRNTLVSTTETALFVSATGRRISVRSIQRLYSRIRGHLGLLKHATPHTARHSFVTAELDLGADITVVSRLAGHASIVTTMKYRHLVDTASRAAVALLGGLIPDEVVPGEQESLEVPAGQLRFNLQRVSTLPEAMLVSANDRLRPRKLGRRHGDWSGS
jgi:site-specific recombinase XerD